MSRRIGPLVLAALVALADQGTGAPVPIRARPAISAANAARLHKVAELPRDAWEVVWGPRRTQVSLLGWERPVEVLDASTFRPVRQIGAGRRPIHFAASRDGQTVAFCENTTRAEVHDLRTGKAVVLETGNPQPGMAFSPDGKLLATGGYGTQARLWDAASGKLLRSLDAPGEGGLTVAFAPGGKTLAVGNRNDVTRLFEVATGNLLATLPRRMSHELKFRPDGRVLAVAYVNGAVGLWEVPSGKLLRSRATGCKEVYTLDWSVRGDVLATAGLRGKVTLWDPRDLSALKGLEAPERVIRVRFSPDGARLFCAGGAATPSPDRKVTVWGLKGGK
jgi:WD40 repeat protein